MQVTAHASTEHRGQGYTRVTRGPSALHFQGITQSKVCGNTEDHRKCQPQLPTLTLTIAHPLHRFSKDDTARINVTQPLSHSAVQPFKPSQPLRRSSPPTQPLSHSAVQPFKPSHTTTQPLSRSSPPPSHSAPLPFKPTATQPFKPSHPATHAATQPFSRSSPPTLFFTLNSGVSRQ